MSNHPKLLIFDFDGTIANTVPHIVNCAVKCIEKFGLKKIRSGDVEKHNGATLADVFKYLGATDAQLPEILKYYSGTFLDDVSDVYLYDNVLETLKELKQRGYILALASNSSKDTLIPLLKSLEIAPLFDKIVCESEVENKKPNADMVELVLAELELTKDETLVVGDTKFDILMGKNANCKSCYICHEEKPNEDVLKSNPDFVINDFSELFKLVNLSQSAQKAN